MLKLSNVYKINYNIIELRNWVKFVICISHDSENTESISEMDYKM